MNVSAADSDSLLFVSHFSQHTHLPHPPVFFSNDNKSFVYCLVLICTHRHFVRYTLVVPSLALCCLQNYLVHCGVDSTFNILKVLCGDWRNLSRRAFSEMFKAPPSDTKNQSSESLKSPLLMLTLNLSRSLSTCLNAFAFQNIDY